MDIEHVKLWPYAFAVTRVTEEKFEQMQQWCANNCNGQWSAIRAPRYRRMTSNDTGIDIILSSPPKFQNEIEGHSYSPASTTVKSQLLFSFQEEGDAVAFKLHFQSSEEVDSSNEPPNPPF